MKIPNYPIDTNISNNDILLGTDAEDANKTKNFRISSIIAYIVAQSLVGATGADGLSAYQVAVEEGFEGTVEEWLESLIGAQGIQGIQGEPGVSPTLPLEFNAQLFQSGTDNPSAQVPQIDTITQGDLGSSDYREVAFARTGVGTYRARLLYETSGYVNTDKCSLMFGDAVARITGTSNGSDGSNFYKEWTFKTYDLTGAEADSQLGGNNGSYINIKIYN